MRFVEDDGKIKTVILDRVRATSRFITGIEVDKEGNEISGSDFDQRRRVISKKAIRRRTPLKMDNKYATLVSDETGKIDLGGGWWATRAENEGPRGGKVGVFNAWEESRPEEVLTFVHLREARRWAQEHEKEVGAREI